MCHHQSKTGLYCHRPISYGQTHHSRISWRQDSLQKCVLIFLTNHQVSLSFWHWHVTHNPSKPWFSNSLGLCSPLMEIQQTLYTSDMAFLVDIFTHPGRRVFNDSTTKISKISDNTDLPHFIVTFFVCFTDTAVFYKVKALWLLCIKRVYPHNVF
jgi:hypothetical protein